MKKKLFDELLESVRQGASILKGETRPSRETKLDIPDVREIRAHYGLSQIKFASLIGISTATLRNWEQGRRRPEGPAQVLLRVAARHPEAVLDAVSSAPPNEEDSWREVARGNRGSKRKSRTRPVAKNLLD